MALRPFSVEQPLLAASDHDVWGGHVRPAPGDFAASQQPGHVSTTTDGGCGRSTILDSVLAVLSSLSRFVLVPGMMK